MIFRFILLGAWIWLSTSAYSQEMSSHESYADTALQRAYDLIDSDPEKAIAVISAYVDRTRNAPGQLATAYALLGDIYVEIDQHDLAVQRYNKALAFLGNSDSEQRAWIYYKKGIAYLSYSPKLAKQAFIHCKEYARTDYDKNLCVEGIADVLLNQDSTEIAIALFHEVEQYLLACELRSDIIRVQSKLANAYSLKNDLDNASINFQNAYSNARISPPQKKNNRQAYEKAKEQIIASESQIENEIRTRGQQIELKQDDPPYQAVEQLKLADAYIRSNEPELALKTLKNANESLIDFEVPDIKADIQKRTSEVYATQGNIDAALDALRSYEDQRILALNAKEAELDRQIAIVKGQQSIDMEEQEYINRSTKIIYDRELLRVQRYIIALLSLLLVLAAISIYIILRNIKAKNRANKLLELKGLRAQMNPHFLFNALNTLNEYIATQNVRKANAYLSDFSGMMRLVLQNSQKDLIPLQEELEMSTRYLELEHRRFTDKFNYEINLDPNLPAEVMLPPLIFQPYLENAIWHGLRYKEDMGTLLFSARKDNDKTVVRIEDNGIGRERSLSQKTHNQKMYQSTGLQNTKKRMQLINELYDTKIELHIDDAFPEKKDCGTMVELVINT